MGTAQQLLIYGGVSAPTDPAFSTVVQLCHFDGANGSTTLTNSASHGTTMGAGSLDTISTTQSVFGGASLRRSTGTESGTVTSADYQFGTNDWTIEFRYRPDALALVNIFDMRASSAGNVLAATIYTLLDGTLIFFLNGADQITSASGVIVALADNAIALSRVSGTTRMFVNGAQVGSSLTDANNYNYAATRVSIPSWVSRASNAYYDELRISNGLYGAGAGRYAANYTIAAAAFPDQ